MLAGAVGMPAGAVGMPTGAVGALAGAVGMLAGAVGALAGAVGALAGAVGAELSAQFLHADGLVPLIVGVVVRGRVRAAALVGRCGQYGKNATSVGIVELHGTCAASPKLGTVMHCPTTQSVSRHSAPCCMPPWVR